MASIEISFNGPWVSLEWQGTYHFWQGEEAGSIIGYLEDIDLEDIKEVARLLGMETDDVTDADIVALREGL